jgi:hypothetical protein
LLSHRISSDALLSLLLLPIICRHLTPSYCAAAAFIVTPLLTSSTRHHSLHRCTAGSAFFVTPPWPSSSRRC